MSVVYTCNTYIM